PWARCGVARSKRRRTTDGIRDCKRDRGAGRGRRLPAAARAHLRRDPRADAAVLCHQPADLLFRAAGDGQAAGAARAGRTDPRQLHRSAAAGAGADRDRDLVRDDRGGGGGGDAQPRRPAQRPRRRPRTRAGAAARQGRRRAGRARMMQHLVLVPILLPLVTGAVLLLFERRHDVRVLRTGAWVGMALLLCASIALLMRADEGRVEAYLLGDWPARLGIVLMLDRLSALMVLTTTLLAIPALLYACAGWDKRALHFHALFQIQLAGLNGAFLTGDIFNLFVFFEVMLIASYGLLLSGARGERIAAGMHYVVFNIAASTLFLIALGLLYGLLGSL